MRLIIDASNVDEQVEGTAAAWAKWCDKYRIPYEFGEDNNFAGASEDYMEAGGKLFEDFCSGFKPTQWAANFFKGKK